jgi:hypothetical protein
MTNGKNIMEEKIKCYTNTAIFQLNHGENKLIFSEMMMRSALYQTNKLRWIFIVQSHWNNSPRIDMSSHSLIPSQLVFALILNAVRLAEKQQIPNSVFGLRSNCWSLQLEKGDNTNILKLKKKVLFGYYYKKTGES